ncbi:DUF4760 domain-containing protein [Providencia huaxiensis]|uniref:DUF4760 domain-containing protein n=1 Tax=Providencia huaxiensis TaxID=2027290 RepID=UPI001E485739|nr:DUF4760 domain-containing protein [Providencia huaxiensis]MCD2526567.1 DUF4760 domain-containing protein [Providencia huaxiensis]
MIETITQAITNTWTTSPTFFAGIFGALIAIIGVVAQRKTSREKNSLEFEAAYKRNDKILKAWDTVLKVYKERDEKPLSLYGTEEKRGTVEAKALATIFNEWERCANAVNHKIYDDKYLYRVFGSTLIFLDIQFEPYMEECRKINPRFYRNLKWLALKWRVRRAHEDHENDHDRHGMDLRICTRAAEVCEEYCKVNKYHRKTFRSAKKAVKAIRVKK